MSKSIKVSVYIVARKFNFQSKVLQILINGASCQTAPVAMNEIVRTPEEIKASRLVVLNDLIESEKAHVAEIRGLFENFLEPLASGQM